MHVNFWNIYHRQIITSRHQPWAGICTALIREIIKNPDPYKEVKHKNNQEMLALYPKFQEMVKTSDHPFQTAMRLAIAGNVIDFGPQHQMDIFETIKRVLESQIAIDHSEQLEKDIEKANSHTLYWR